MNSSGLIAIGEALRQYRKRKKLTQADVAGKIGIHRQNISDIERGVFVGAISTLQKYLLFAGLELSCQGLPSEFPQLEDLNSLFEEDV
jgi:transcriptional regulator with XRE-family HTH domain